MKTDLFRNSPTWVLALLIVGATWAAFIATASAKDVTVSWTNPTKNTDESAIDATGSYALKGTRVEWGTCDGTAFGTKEGEVSAAAPATSAVIQLAPGTWCVRAFSVNNSDATSESSNVTVKTASMPVPCPPEVEDTPPATKKPERKPPNRKAAQITVEK